MITNGALAEVYTVGQVVTDNNIRRGWTFVTVGDLDPRKVASCDGIVNDPKVVGIIDRDAVIRRHDYDVINDPQSRVRPIEETDALQDIVKRFILSGSLNDNITSNVWSVNPGPPILKD